MSDLDPRAAFLAGRERAAQHWLAFWQDHAQEPEALAAAYGHVLRALTWCAMADSPSLAAIDLALAVDVHMIRQGQWHDWEPLLRRFVAQAGATGSPERQYALRHSLATICFRLHRLEESIALSQDNHRWATAIGDRRRQAQAAINLAEAYLNAEVFDRALAHAEEAAALGAALHLPWMEADGMIDAARASMGLGELAAAEQRLRQADVLASAAGYPVYQAKAQLFLGQVLGRRGCWQEALAHLETARQLVASYGDEVGRATVQIHLGRALAELGRPDEAVQVLEDAVIIQRRHGNWPAERAAVQRLQELRARKAWLAGSAAVGSTG